VARLVEVWDGGHQWAPAALFGWGLDWMLARRLDALFHEDIKDEISESYDWYFEYEHKKFQTADQAGERIQAGRALVALGRRMGDGLSGSRKDRLAATARALAEAEAAAPGAGEALDSLLAVLAEDSGGEGRNLETVAAAYDAVAARYPDTWAGALAARRAQSVRWERLVVR